MRKKFRVAVEGQTTDRREISRVDIQQMAKNYNPQTYGARIWMEHFRSIVADSPFKAYGDVISLSTEEISDGPLKGKLALYAEIEPTADLVAMAKAKQKVYFSIEIHPNFAGTGEAYLDGLGVTDSPASLGTEYLKFSATAQTNPLASRKNKPENFFSTAECEWAFSEELPPTPAAGPGILEKVKGWLYGHQQQSQHQQADVGKAVEEVARYQADLNTRFTALEAKISTLTLDLQKEREAFSAFKKTVDNTPNQQAPRPGATGGDGAQLTDC